MPISGNRVIEPPEFHEVNNSQMMNGEVEESYSHFNGKNSKLVYEDQVDKFAQSVALPVNRANHS
jgi:hypothetical protein